MAKFTVFFKDKPINSSFFEAGIVHIGRDETNDLSIDSLAIAPAHAVVVVGDSESTIKQLNADFPLVINGEQKKECNLKNGDILTLGKHRIIYSSTEAIAPIAKKNPPEIHSEALNQELSHHDHIPEANFQVMSGKHIGRLVPLKKTMTRLGRNGAGMLIVTRRKEGYYVSMLETDEHIKLNNKPLADRAVLLKNNDVLLVDNVPMQFFMD